MLEHRHGKEGWEAVDARTAVGPESTELSRMTMPTASKRLSDARARSGPLVEAGGSNDETLCTWTNASG